MSRSDINRAILKRHQSVCIKGKKFHPIQQCPFMDVHVCSCGNLVIWSSCKKCHKRRIILGRDSKLRGEIGIGLELGLTEESINSVKQIINDDLTNLGENTIKVVKETISDVPQVLAESGRISANIMYDDLKNKIGDDLTAFYEIFKNKIREDLTPLFTQAVTDKIMSWILDLVLLFRVWKDKVAVCLHITRILSSHGLSHVAIETFLDYWRSFNQPSNTNLEGQIGTTSVVTLVLAMTHAMMFQQCPNFRGLTQFVSNLCRLRSSVMSIENLIDTIKTAGSLFKRWVLTYILKIDQESFEEKVDPFLGWSEEVDVLFTSQDRKEGVWKLETINHLDKLYSRALDMRKDRTFLDLEASIRMVFTMRFSLLQKMLDEVSQSGARQQSRIEPYLFYLWGESGCGKSLITPKIIIHYLAKYHPEELKKHKYDHVACTYVRKSGDPRWDGVGDQCVYIYDDYGQMKDTGSKPNQELFETIELANTTPFNPLMAELNRKGRVQLAPRLIMYTSNVICPPINTLEKPLAVARRFDAIWEIKIKEQYLTTTGSIDLNKIAEHHPTQCGCDSTCDICLEAMMFQKWEVKQQMNGTTMEYEHKKSGGLVSLDELIQTMLSDVNTKYNGRTKRKDYFKNLARSLVIQNEGLDEALCGESSDEGSGNLTESDISIINEDGPNNLVGHNGTEEFIDAPTHTALEAIAEGRNKFISVLKQFPLVSALAGLSAILGVFSTLSLFKKNNNAGETGDGGYRFRRGKRHVIAEGGSQAKVYSQPLLNSKDDLESQGMSDGNLTDIMRVVYRNSYMIYDENGVIRGNLTVISGRIALVFKHVLSTIKNGFYLQNVYTKNRYKCAYPNRLFDIGNNQDMCVFELPRIIQSGTKIIKYFTSYQDIVYKSHFDSRLLTFAGGMTRIHYGPSVAKDEIVGYDVLGDEIVIRHHYEYNFDTERGYCGSLLFRVDSQNTTKILGMHVAGSKSESFGVASAIDRDQLERAIKKFSLEAQCEFPIFDYNVNLSDEQTDLIQLNNLGSTKDCITQQRKTRIKQSPMHGWDGEPIKIPCQLSGMHNDIDVTSRGRDKLKQSNKTQLDARDLEQAKIMCLKKTLGFSVSDRRIWTLEEAVFGNPEDEYCRALDVTTSAGMPWKKMSRNRKGKTGFIDKNKYVIHVDLLTAVEKRITAAKEGKRVATIWSDHYKDECRTIVNEKYTKPRLFSGGPLDFTIVMRMYFGSFCAHIMRNRIENGIAVGINPHSDEWSLLARKLLSTSDKCFAGDFSNYDGTLHAEILWAVCDVINIWYDDEYGELRKVIFFEIVNSVHLTRNFMYHMDHGNPSGNPLTSILNSVYQLISSYYVLLQLGKTPNQIEQHFTTVIYGDDNINSVSGGENWLNLEEFGKMYKDALGMTLTCADKTGKPKYQQLSECDFLSRSFRLEDGRWYGPRKWENISCMFHWTFNTMPWSLLLPQYLECAAYELSHHSKAEFDARIKQIKAYCKQQNMQCGFTFQHQYYRDTLQHFGLEGVDHSWLDGTTKH